MYLWLPKSQCSRYKSLSTHYCSHPCAAVHTKRFQSELVERHTHLSYHKTMCRSSLNTHLPPFSTPTCRRSHEVSPIGAGWASLPSWLPQNHVPLQSWHPCAALPCGSSWCIIDSGLWDCDMRLCTQLDLWYEVWCKIWHIECDVSKKAVLQKVQWNLVCSCAVEHNWNTEACNCWQFGIPTLENLSKSLWLLF